MIYNRVRRKPLLRDYLSGGFLLWMHFVKRRELLRVEHIANVSLQRPPKIESLANFEPIGRCKIPLN